MGGAVDKDNSMEDAEDDLTDEEEEAFFDKACEAYFAYKNLISHQLDSYNHFLAKDMDRVFEGAPLLTIKPTHSKTSIQADGMLSSAEINFGRITLRKPEWTDQKGRVSGLYPTEARLRKMTYSASIYVDINVKIFVTKIDEEDSDDGSNFHWQRKKGKDERTCYTKIPARGGKQVEKQDTLKGAFVGKIPVMVMSDACHLPNLRRENLIRKGHCLFDNGGYFIVKGSEKLQVALSVPCWSGGSKRVQALLLWLVLGVNSC